METALFLGVSQEAEVLRIAKGKSQAMCASRKNVMCSKEAQTQISTDLDKCRLGKAQPPLVFCHSDATGN
jgi:hypothetical protein